MKITKDLLKKIISEELQEAMLGTSTINLEIENDDGSIDEYKVEYEDGKATAVNNIAHFNLQQSFLEKIDKELPEAINNKKATDREMSAVSRFD